MDMKKELEDFGVRLGGAFLGMEESAATEIYFRTHEPGSVGQFPFNELIPGLAPTDNLIVAALAIPPWVIGYLVEEDAEKKGDMKTKAMGEALRKFGEGDAVYSFTLPIHHTLVRNIPSTGPIQARATESRPPPGQGIPTVPGQPRITSNAVRNEVRISDGRAKVGMPGSVRIST